MKGRSRFPGLLLTIGFALLTACSQSPPPRAAVREPEPQDARDQHRELETTGELGGLNEEQVTRAFERCMRGLQQCINDGAERVEYIGGDVGFALEVDRSGSLTNAYLEHSTLGDRDTERCMLNVLKQERWPKPIGGDKGLARKSFSFEPPKDVRPPVDWPSDHIERSLAKLSGDLAECTSADLGSFTATLYVDTSGKAISAGIAPPSAQAEQAADCLLGVLMAARYPSPGSWAAKVSFQL
ncbi:AgmX/PglI C-terminal domain-containing protein [Myxococcota bacterium]